MIITAAFAPIPPDTERGAWVLVDCPMRIPESESDESIVFPVPADVSVRLPFVVVAMVADAPPPRLSVVESIERVAEASIVVRFPAFIVVRPAAERVVSDAAIVRVLSPESSVSVFTPPEVIVPAPAKSNELMSRTDPSTFTKPRSALSLIVTDPVVPETENSLKLIAVAPPLIAVSDVPLSTVVPVRFTVSELSPNMLPVAPLRGEILMFPVVVPPRVNVWLFVV